MASPNSPTKLPSPKKAGPPVSISSIREGAMNVTIEALITSVSPLLSFGGAHDSVVMHIGVQDPSGMLSKYYDNDWQFQTTSVADIRCVCFGTTARRLEGSIKPNTVSFSVNS